MDTSRQRLREYVRHVVLGADLAHLDAAMRDVLPHLQVAAVDVPRSLARASFFGQLDSARIVH
eukprot:5318313-Pleurochrysis_carterae.AAC.1